MDQLPRETDVVIIGGGPAGLATAIAARQRGLGVVVADHARPPIDKACGEGVMPDGVEALLRLGITIGPEESCALRGVRFIEGELSAQAAFEAGHGLGIRRSVLHQRLSTRAMELGCVIHWGVGARVLGAGEIQIGGQIVRCRWIVGADGQNSRVRQWARLGAIQCTPRRIGVRRHYLLKPWTGFVEVYWDNHRQAYVTPVAPDQVCVALIGDAWDRLSGPSFHDPVAELARYFPVLAGLLKDAPPISSPRGGLSMTIKLRSVIRDRLALTGDASGSIDAVTGDGLSLAFRQALALAGALADDNVALYERAHRRITRIPRLMARLMMTMDGHPALRHRVLRGLAARPRAFSHLLAVHGGALTPLAVLPDVAGLAARMLVPGPQLPLVP